MTTAEDLMEFLSSEGIKTHTYEHPPVFTVEEARRLRGDLPGGHCKSLFLRDKKRNCWLVVALEHQKVDLKDLRRTLGAHKNLSFGSPELLLEVLGVTPGAVTPFAALHDRAGRAQVVLDRAMLEVDPLNYHPMRNDRTTAISPPDLLRFLRACGHDPAFVDF